MMFSSGDSSGQEKCNSTGFHGSNVIFMWFQDFSLKSTLYQLQYMLMLGQDSWIQCNMPSPISDFQDIAGKSLLFVPSLLQDV